jgi:hypothetical protein
MSTKKQLKSRRTKNTGTKKEKQPKATKVAVGLDHGHPSYMALENIVREGVIFGNLTAQAFYLQGKAFCKAEGIKGFTKTEATRMHTVYQTKMDESVVQGPFHVALFKMAAREHEFRMDLIKLLSKFESDSIQDLRDHVSDFDGVQTGTGQAWYKLCVASVDKMEVAGYDIGDLGTRSEDLFPVEVALSSMPEESKVD